MIFRFKVPEMAMYPGLEVFAVSLGQNLTVEHLKEFIFNDRSGKALKNIVGSARTSNPNLSILEVVQREIQAQPYAWNKYSQEVQTLILNLAILIDKIEINWYE